MQRLIGNSYYNPENFYLIHIAYNLDIKIFNYYYKIDCDKNILLIIFLNCKYLN